MRLTPALHVRQWLAKLHPPLPQTPRESQQLLRILEGSFRRHLDEVHPSPKQRASAGAAQSEIPLASPESASHATDRYFTAVLNNPLIAKSNDVKDTQKSLITTAVAAFTRASNEGAVNVNLLRRCALDYLQGLKNGEEAANHGNLAEKIASWIHSANASVRESFFVTADVLRLAVQVAGADRQEAIAWDWLRMLYERKFGSGSTMEETSITELKWLTAEDHLVSQLMSLSIRRGALSDAAQQYLEACRYRSASQRAAARLADVSNTLAYVPFEQSWKRLAAAIIHYRTKHDIPERLFDQVIQFGLPWSVAPELSAAVACIYHPTAPSASSLTQHLQKSESAAQFLSTQIKAGRKSRRAMLTMILDGAQLSLSSGVRSHARFLLEFARIHYSELSPSVSHKVQPSLDVQIQSAQDELKAHSHNFAWV